MRIRASSLAAAALLSLSSAPLLAQGPASLTADVHLRRGLELAKDSDWDAALVELRRAYAFDPRWQTLFEVGRAASQVHRYAEALDAFEKYLADGGTEVPADRREEAQKEIDKLRTRVATLMVTTGVPGAEITVDDAPAGKTPLAAPIRVSAGHRRVTATRPGKPPVSQVVELAGGDQKRITLVFPEEAAPPAPPAPEPGPAPPAARRYTWLPWLVTGALGAGAVATGVLALQASSDLRKKLDTYPLTPGDLHSAHTKTMALAVTTDALAAGTLLLGGLSIYYTLQSPAAVDEPRAALGIHLAPQGVRISGAF